MPAKLSQFTLCALLMGRRDGQFERNFFPKQNCIVLARCHIDRHTKIDVTC